MICSSILIPLSASFLLYTVKGDSDACDQPLEKGNGNCYSKTPGKRYYFDSESKNCEAFAYLGCDGNDNRFKSEGDCLTACAFTFQGHDEEEEISAFGDVFVENNGMVDEIEFKLQEKGEISKGWITRGIKVIDKSSVLDYSSNNTETSKKEAEEYAIVPINTHPAELSFPVKSLRHHHFEMSFSFLTLDTSSSIRVNIQKYGDGDKYVESNYVIFDTCHYKKLIKNKRNWTDIKFNLHDSEEMEYGGRLAVYMKKSTEESVVAVSNMRLHVIPLMSDAHYSINTGEELGPIGSRTGSLFTTLEVILIIACLILFVFAAFVSYRHWVQKNHSREYKTNDVRSKSPPSNPVYDQNSASSDRYGSINEK